MAHQSRYAGYASIVAAASMAFTPANAAEASVQQGTLGYATSVHAQFAADPGSPFGTSSSVPGEEVSEYYGFRRYGRRGYRRHRRVRGGDVLAGVLILGGIAAVASAASNSRNRNRNEVRNERRDDRRYDDRRTNRRSNSGSGIDSAVDQCLNEIERDVRVESVDGASRVASGWLVSGSLFNGTGFTCQIDNNGRIADVSYGGSFGGPLGSADGSTGNQWSDDRYANARAAAGPQQPDLARNAAQSGAQPAYPGGPLPGESFAE